MTKMNQQRVNYASEQCIGAISNINKNKAQLEACKQDAQNRIDEVLLAQMADSRHKMQEMSAAGHCKNWFIGVYLLTFAYFFEYKKFKLAHRAVKLAIKHHHEQEEMLRQSSV